MSVPRKFTGKMDPKSVRFSTEAQMLWLGPRQEYDAYSNRVESRFDSSRPESSGRTPIGRIGLPSRLAGETSLSSAAMTAAEFASWVGIAKFGYDASTVAYGYFFGRTQ
jgi:hypothetical protein